MMIARKVYKAKLSSNGVHDLYPIVNNLCIIYNTFVIDSCRYIK